MGLLVRSSLFPSKEIFLERINNIGTNKPNQFSRGELTQHGSNYQKGGRGRSATFDSMNTAANDGLGKYPARGVLYESCDSQSGGGGYGFTQASVKNADTFRGSYPEYVKYEKTNQCGGKRRRKSRRKRRR